MAFTLPEDFKKISLQSIFDKSWDAFIVGDKPPARTVGRCVYLTKDGDKCAVGLCIPDGHPAQSYRGNLATLTVKYPELFDDQILSLKGSSYLYEFQARLHDSLSDYDSINGKGVWKYNKTVMRTEYINVAEKYGLTVPKETAV